MGMIETDLNSIVKLLKAKNIDNGWNLFQTRIFPYATAYRIFDGLPIQTKTALKLAKFLEVNLTEIRKGVTKQWRKDNKANNISTTRAPTSD